ncbi:MAG: class I SAM-dependent methyltransferase [bacterium]
MMQENAVLGCKLSKSISFSQDEELYIATTDTKIKMEEDYAPFVDKILNNISYIPNKILDLGCGPGYIARRINEVLPDAFVFGVDKSGTMINHANKVFKKTLKNNYAFNSGYRVGSRMFEMFISEQDCLNYGGFRLKYMIADSASLPFGNFNFDLIILKGTFKCLDDKLNSLKEMHRVLSHGGEIFIYEFRKDIPDDEFNMLTKKMNPQKVKSLRRKLNCSLDIPEYKKYLFEAGLSGFSVIEPDGLDLRIRISKNC